MELFFGGILPYVSFTIFICASVLRIAVWLRAPVPFQLTLFPVSDGKIGKAAALAKEFLFCGTLFRENRFLWLWVWLFHFSLAMILIGHLLGIYFLRGQFTLIGADPETSSLLSRTLGAVMGAVMTVSIATLLCRRLFSPETRRLSEPLAWFDLSLLLAVALSGLGMYLPDYHADLPAVRAYMGSVVSLRPGPLPSSTVFIVHFSLVNFLLLYFPFSQLVHSAGFFVNRAMLIEAVPIFPTPPGKPARSPFAEHRPHPDIFPPHKETDGREGPHQ